MNISLCKGIGLWIEDSYNPLLKDDLRHILLVLAQGLYRSLNVKNWYTDRQTDSLSKILVDSWYQKELYTQVTETQYK